MRIPQLSLVIDNRPGSLDVPCKLLAEAGINIITLMLAEAGQHGSLRLIVEDWQQTMRLLQAAGYAVTATDVVAIEVRDEPGGLVELLDVFKAGGVNVAYMYAFASRMGQSAVMVFSFNDLDAAIAALTRSGINPVAPINLYRRLDER